MMENQQLLRFLQQSGKIDAVTALEIADRFTYRKLARNDYFLKEGQVSDEYLFLDRGYMRSYAFNTEGDEVTTGFPAPNQVVFEVSSFFNRTPSKENIQALTDCEGWMISFEQLNHLFHSLPQFREFGRGVLVKGYATLKDRMLSTITETAEERYRQLLSGKPELFEHVPLKYIASYLGITDSSLSRIRKEVTRK